MTSVPITKNVMGTNGEIAGNIDNTCDVVHPAMLR